jgi:hypothetical protein
MSSIGLKSSDKKLLTSTHPYSHNIAIDWIHNLIYFNYDLDIHVMNISNNRMRAIIAKNELFGDIVVNPFESFIVWTRSVPNPSIVRTNQDGSNKTVLDDRDLINPFSIVIDFETKVIYFMDLNPLEFFKVYKLFSFGFNGNDRKLVHQFKANNPSYDKGVNPLFMSLDIYLSNLYVYNGISSEFIKMNSDGLIIDKIKIKDDTPVRSMKIVDSSRQPNGQNKCIDSNCTHLCLPNTHNKFVCVCPEKQYLLAGEICESVRYYIKRVAITSPTETSTTVTSPKN